MLCSAPGQTAYSKGGSRSEDEGKECNNECVGAKKERGVVPSQTRNRSSIEQEKVEKVDCRPEGAQRRTAGLSEVFSTTKHPGFIRPE